MRTRKLLIVLVLLSVLLNACQPNWQDTKSEFWGDDAVFYQIFVRSFYDSDGDGTGDFNGITAKLDYLNDGDPKTTTDLGVTGIWLMPIFPSPSYHGYDVTDYMNVNSQYGTLDDFKNLVNEAHKRGIHVIIDYVINHTSRQHPWFKAAEAGDPAYRDYYIWSDTNPGYPGPWGQEVWHESGGSYFYGVFSPDMPDLNYRSPAVTAEVQKITAFWLQDVGIDGFRVDGAKHLIEEGQAQENTEATHAWLKEFREYYKGLRPDAFMVGEVWSSGEEPARYVNDGEMDRVFNFDLAEDMITAVSGASTFKLYTTLKNSERIYVPGDYAPFLSNHDQVRTMTRLGEKIGKAKMAASILLTVPGTPFIYYGEEIGMSGSKPDPNLRTPMHWDDSENAGFTTGYPWSSPKLDYAEKNVKVESADPDSLLSHYRELIRIRSNHYALRTGAYIEVSSPSGLFAMLRSAEMESVLVLVNLTDKPIANPALSWNSSTLTGTLKPVVLLGEGKANAFTTGERGSAKDYVALAEIGPGETVIIQFVP
jgi:alpha-amylase